VLLESSGHAPLTQLSDLATALLHFKSLRLAILKYGKAQPFLTTGGKVGAKEL